MTADVVSIVSRPSAELNRWLRDGEWNRIARAIDDGVSIHLVWPEGGTLWQRILLHIGRSQTRPSSVHALNQRNLVRRGLRQSVFGEEDLVAGVTQSVWWARPDLLQLFAEESPQRTASLSQGVFEMVVRRTFICEDHYPLPAIDAPQLGQTLVLLHNLGARLSGEPFEAKTPLQVARAANDPVMVEALLRAGATPLQVNREGKSTWDEVLETEDLPTLRLMLTPFHRKFLMEHGTPLVNAASRGRLALFRVLLPHAQHRQVLAAWFEAARTNHVSILQAIETMDPALSWLGRQDEQGNSALHWACLNNAPTARRWLLDQGALNLPNAARQTPAMIWARQDHAVPDRQDWAGNVVAFPGRRT